MNLNTLRYFLVISREENITRAADQVHISQPSLSRQMMLLEEELGVKLFIRGKHKVTLTKEGQLLYRRAQELVALADKTEMEIKQSADNISGEIAFGCGETKNVACLSDMMLSFRERYPSVTFVLYTAAADEVKQQLGNGTLDFGLLVEPTDITKYNYVRMPIKERWCALMKKDESLAQEKTISPKDLAGKPLIMSRRSDVRNELENWFGDYRDELNVVCSRNLSYNNSMIMVQRGLGISLVHEFEGYGNDLCLRPLQPEIADNCVLVWKKSPVLSSAAEAFTAFIKEYDFSIFNNLK